MLPPKRLQQTYAFIRNCLGGLAVGQACAAVARNSHLPQIGLGLKPWFFRVKRTRGAKRTCFGNKSKLTRPYIFKNAAPKLRPPSTAALSLNLQVAIHSFGLGGILRRRSRVFAYNCPPPPCYLSLLVR